MKIKLIIFSGTGNTRFIAEKMKHNFESKSHQCRIIEFESLHNEIKIESDEILGFGYPVYDLKPPRVLLDFINKCEVDNIPINAFVFSTYTSYPLDSNAHIIKSLNEKNVVISHEENFKCPGASAYIYSNPNNILAKNSSIFEKNISGKIDKFIKRILSQKNNPITPKFDRFNKLHQRFSNLLFGTLFYRNLKIDTKCSSCGVCIKNCPDNNLMKINNKIQIKDPNGCIKCLRCVQNCLLKSINFTSSSRKGDYKLETITREYYRSQI